MGIFEDAMERTHHRTGGLPALIASHRKAAPGTHRVSRTNLSQQLWQLELHLPDSLPDLLDDVTSLANRSLDQNLFFGPAVLTACWPRMAALIAPHGAHFLCVYESTDDNTRQLRFFAPVQTAKVGLPARQVLQILSSDYAPLGTPLLDETIPVETLENLFQLLADPALKLPKIVDFIHQRQESKTYQALQTAAKNLGFETGTARQHRRALLTPNSDMHNSLSKKRRKEFSRQERRLAELGSLSIARYSSPETIADALDAFLMLESKGWKGRRGTALYNKKQTTAFARQMLTQLCDLQCAEITALKLDGKTIASLILFKQDGNWITWKITFDEAYAAYSPGVQLMVQTTQLMIQEPNFREADSLAIENHPMIDSLWRSRITILDFVIQLSDDTKQDLTRVLNAKSNLTRVRRFARNAQNQVWKIIRHRR